MLSKDTVKKLLRIQREISREPRRFFMEWWIETNSPIAPCGTAACIGGWAIILDKAAKKKIRITGKTLPELSYSLVDHGGDSARKILGLDITQSGDLFNAERWPEPYRTRFNKAPRGSKQAAKVAIDRIDYFIKTNGQDYQ